MNLKFISKFENTSVSLQNDDTRNGALKRWGGSGRIAAAAQVMTTCHRSPSDPVPHAFL